MRFFRKLFGNSFQEAIPDVVLGRYSDAFKDEKKYDAWDRAIKHFEKKEYKACYNELFDYLLDPEQDNLTFKEENGRMSFELLQGSKVIVGYIDDRLVKAEAKVARSESLVIGLLRRMVEINFSLKYGRFAIDPDNNLTLIFDSYLVDASPYKLYFALKEIAVNADKQDDILVQEFDQLEPVNTGHIKDIPESEKEIKHAFLRKKIKAVFDEIESGSLNKDQYPGGIGYLLLDLIYRLDFLIKPEGTMMEAIERIHRLFFAPDGRTPSQKNISMQNELQKIYDASKEDFFKELYVTPASFGITSPSNQQQLSAFIGAEISHMDWYLENKHYTVALAIPGYITGYFLFNYALPPPLRELLILYYRITEPLYFKELGFQPPMADLETGEPDKYAILDKVESIESEYKAQYGDFGKAHKKLKFTSLTTFAKSYMIMLTELDIKKRSEE